METLYLPVKMISNSARKYTNNSLCDQILYLQLILSDPPFKCACRAPKKIQHCNVKLKENHENVAFFSSDFYLEHYKIQTISVIQSKFKKDSGPLGFPM